MRELIWEGDEGRPLQVCRPCPCGCDQRGGYEGVGYITGSTEDGRGFTLWVDDEEVLERMLEVVEAIRV